MTISYQSRYHAAADLYDAVSKIIFFMDDTSMIAELDEFADLEGLDLNDYVDRRHYFSRILNQIPDLQLRYQLQDDK